MKPRFSRFESFAGPRFGDESVFDDYGNALFVSLCSAVLDRPVAISPSLRSLLVDSRDFFRPGTKIWHPAVSRSLADVSVGGAIQLGCLIHSLGGCGSWQQDVENAVEVMVGVDLVRMKGSIACVARGGQIELSFDASGRESRRWHSRLGIPLGEDPSNWPPMLKLDDRVIPVLGAESPIATVLLPEDEHPGVAPVRELADELQAAWDFIKRVSPSYYVWAKRLLACVVAARPHGTRLTNGSASDLPGVVYLSHPGDVRSHSCIMVHECTHQYFYLASMVSPVLNGNDTELYFSPLKNTDRPLDKILVGFHADANILLYVKEVLTRSPADPFYQGERALLEHDLALLERPLRSTHGLTALGEALWRPLAMRLRKDGIDSAKDP